MGSRAGHITGLPRTMGCWFSIIINAHASEHGLYSSIEAYHELLTHVESVADYEAIMYNDNVPLVVDCSSLTRYRAGDKIVIVHRDKMEVLSSLWKLPVFKGTSVFQLEKSLEVLEARLARLIPTITPATNLLTINYKILATVAGVSVVLKHLGIVPQPAIIEQWLNVNIQAQYLNNISYEEFLAMGTHVTKLLEEPELPTSQPDEGVTYEEEFIDLKPPSTKH